MGKTLLLRQLTKEDSADGPLDTATIPSVGTELRPLQHHGSQVLLREMGGTMQPVWPRYFDESDAIVFVVDVSNKAQLATSSAALYDVLAAEKVARIPVLIALNKADVEGGMEYATLNAMLRISDLRSRRERQCTVVLCTAMTREGVQPILSWLRTEVSLRTANTATAVETPNSTSMQ